MKKMIDYRIERNYRIHTSKRGKRYVVWFDTLHVWMAPEYKLYQSKKYDKSNVDLIEII